jgi:hypothetical protein
MNPKDNKPFQINKTFNEKKPNEVRGTGKKKFLKGRKKYQYLTLGKGSFTILST